MGNRGAVLVTRPEGQAEALCEALAARGFTAFAQPLLELQPLPSVGPEAHATIENLADYRHIIFISGNAVRFGLPEIQARWPQLPTAVQVYAIGERTAVMLRNGGVEAICASPAMTSEALLSLPQLQAVAGDKILIVKGEGGRQRLREDLSRRGAAVAELVCYRRLCPTFAPGELADKLSNWAIERIMISSGEGLCNLLTLLSPAETINLWSVPVIVPSRRVARMAEEAGFSTVYTAENASDAAMLKMVEYSSSMLESKQ
jgi:uroporphyrinogen-III synthase